MPSVPTADKTFQGAASVSRLRTAFVGGGDLTHASIIGLDLKGLSAPQVLFRGSMFRECKFRKCDFSRADFEATVIEECDFEDCNFSSSDLRSTEMARCSFVECNFDSSEIRSCMIIQCEFERTTFRQQSFSENKIRATRFSRCSFSRSSLQHDKFADTRFEAIDFSDCTSIHHLFDACTFIDCRADAEQLGSTFGLTRENLLSLELVFRGSAINNREQESLLADLLTTYEARGWLFAAATLRLNFDLTPRLLALDGMLQALGDAVRRGRPLRDDELRFLGNVVEFLATKQLLPFLFVAHALEFVVRINEIASGRDVDALKQLYYELKDIEQRCLEALEEVVVPLLSLPSVEAGLARFAFRKKPAGNLEIWLRRLHELRKFSGVQPTVINVRIGSYLAYIEMTAAHLLGIIVVLYCIEGILYRLTLLRARTELLFSSKLPAPVRKKALDAPTPVPERLSHQIREILQVFSRAESTEFIAETHEIASDLEDVRFDPSNEPNQSP